MKHPAKNGRELAQQVRERRTITIEVGPDVMSAMDREGITDMSPMPHKRKATISARVHQAHALARRKAAR